MPRIKNYGVWACRIIDYQIETAIIDQRSPHIKLQLKDNDSLVKSAAINIKSTDRRDSDLIYWVSKDYQHEITTSLQDLELGFHLAEENEQGVFNLDFVRTQPQLLNINDGIELPHDVPGPDNDIIDKLHPIIADAMASSAIVYIFGSNWNDDKRPGIHDIHMNQGSLPRYDNGAWTDGALMFKFPDGHFEAVFLAFASQRLPTDDRTGEALGNNLTLSDIVRNQSWTG